MFSALVESDDGRLADVTNGATWRVEGDASAVFLLPGVLVAGEQRASDIVTLRVEYESLIAAREVMVVNEAPPNGEAPLILITGPTSENRHLTTEPTVTLEGIVDFAVGEVRVSWSNGRIAQGEARGGAEWSTAPIPLRHRVSTIVVKAVDGRGLEAETSLEVELVPETAGEAAEPALAARRPSFACGAMGFWLLPTAAMRLRLMRHSSPVAARRHWPSRSCGPRVRQWPSSRSAIVKNR